MWRVNTVTSTSQLHQPSTMWGRTGGVWVCGGLTPSLQHHNCINRQLCGVELGVCGGSTPSLQHHNCINRQLCGVELGVCGCVEGQHRHFNITTASTVNYVGSNWGCMGVWRVNTVTSTSQLRQPSTMWGRTVGVWVCGGLTPSLQHHICINRQLCGVEVGVCGCVEG